MTIEVNRRDSKYTYRIEEMPFLGYNYSCSNRINSRGATANRPRPDTRKVKFLMQPQFTPNQSAQENTEEWRDVPGYEGYYQVSSFGRVRSLDRVIPRAGDLYSLMTIKGRIMKSDPNSPDGYKRLALKKSGAVQAFMLHQLVALAFLGPRPAGHDTHHIDGNKRNNAPSNLEYVPSREHSSMHSAGEKCWRAKLTREQAEEIKRLLFLGGLQPIEIAPMYDVSRSAVEAIRAGRTWK